MTVLKGLAPGELVEAEETGRALFSRQPEKAEVLLPVPTMTAHGKEEG